jgi:membrane-bound serine protease (ClpP class)
MRSHDRDPLVRARRRALRLAGAAALIMLGLSALARPAPAPDGRTVRVVELEGVVSPVSARYFTRALEQATGDGDTAVVLRIDTPGGLLDSTREMTQAMLAARVPVITWVGPSGARAASAGMFLLVAGHVAAMAPGTHVGAAHPVQAGGEDPEGALGEKAVNDAAAMARALARERGRDAVWPEEAVRKSVSATSDEALRRGVVDLLAQDLEALLEAVDGRTVTTAAGTVRLATRGAEVVAAPMSLPERLLQAILHPNVAYLLFTLGLIGLMAELYSPGALFPGIAGGISLLLAFTAFGVLPVSWAGIALVVAGVGLIGLELLTEGIGVLGPGGVVAFVAGSLLLYRPSDPLEPAARDVRVSGWLVALVAAVLVGFLLVVGRALLKSRHRPVAMGPEALVGRTGVAASNLEPEGTVLLDRESWTAVTESGPVPRGATIRVIGVRGVRLRVERAPGP